MEHTNENLEVAATALNLVTTDEVATDYDAASIDAGIAKFRKFDKHLRERGIKLDRDKLEAWIDMWKRFHQWGGVTSDHLNKRLESAALKPGRKYTSQPYIQDFTGVVLHKVEDRARRANLSSHITAIAAFWSALDAKFADRTSDPTEVLADEVVSIRAFTDAAQKGVSAADVGADQDDLTQLRFASVANSGSPTAEFEAANETLDRSISFNAVVGGKLRLFVARSLPSTIMDQISKHIAAGDLATLDPILGLLADVVAVTSFIPDEMSDEPKIPGADRNAKSTERLPAHRQILVQEKGLRLVISQARREARPVVVVTQIGTELPEGFVDVAGRKAFAQAVVPQALRATFGKPAQTIDGTATKLSFPHHSGGTASNLRIRPMASFGSSKSTKLWSLDIEDGAAPTSHRLLPPVAIAGFKREFLRASRKQLDAHLLVSFDAGAVTFTLGSAKPVSLASTGEAEAGLKISILGGDLISAMKAVLAEHDLKQLLIGINPAGLCELSFQTQWATYSIFIPSVSAKGQVRSDKLLKRIERPAA